MDISLNGSYQKNNSDMKITYRRSLGLDLGLPIGRFFEVSAGYLLHQQIDKYTELYKQSARNKGYNLPDDTLEMRQNENQISLNGSMGMWLNSIRPSIFGGALWRKACQEDTFSSYECFPMKLTWNAGVGIALALTYRMRIKISYRISPSVEDAKKQHDELTTVGWIWSL